MTHYYIKDLPPKKSYVEVSESEFNSLIGNDIVRPYVNKVYRGVLTIDDVPEEYQTEVSAIVVNKIAIWGEYNKNNNSNEATINDYQDALGEFGVKV